jgi:hypothetical protein
MYWLLGWLISKLLDRFFEKAVIGRSVRPSPGAPAAWSPLLTRWVLWGHRERRDRPRVFIHRFHASDPDHFHDHPMGFRTLILAGGYYERTPEGRFWRRPLSLLRRPPEWTHRVELPPGRECWTLVWAGVKVREWYFHCPSGLTHWKSYEANMAAGLPGCGD